MRKSAQTEQDVLPIVAQCLEGVQRCTDSINEKEVRLGRDKAETTFSGLLNSSVDTRDSVSSMKLQLPVQVTLSV